MSKSINNLSGILNQTSKAGGRGSRSSGSLSPTNLVSNSGSGNTTAKSGKAGVSNDLKFLSLNPKAMPSGIKFGSVSNSRSSTTRSGSEWASLLKQTASGGIASALGGGLGLSGIGSLVSGIMSLFGGGGKSTPPPLVQFQLPASQEETVYVASKGSTVYQGVATQQPAASTSSQTFQYQSAQVAQAVKTALLNSSSLNDVIAEI